MLKRVGKHVFYLIVIKGEKMLLVNKVALKPEYEIASRCASVKVSLGTDSTVD